MCINPNLLIQPLAALVVVNVAYRLGLLAYRRQKEYELVRARYLEAGVDRVAANIEYALAVLRQNEAHALRVLKVFRDIGAAEAALICKPESFVELDNSRMEIGAAHRLRALSGKSVFWDLLQSLFADIHSASSFYQRDVSAIVGPAQDDPSKIPDPDAAVERVLAEAKEWSSKIERYYRALSALHTLARVLERERFTLKGLDRFRDRAEVKEIVAHVEALMKEAGEP